MTNTVLTLALPDEAATESLAQRIAPLVRHGGRIHLAGDLGAGKTTFARALLRACGISGRIKSPTFALVEVYELSNLYFYHLISIDLQILANGWTQAFATRFETMRWY